MQTHVSDEPGQRSTPLTVRVQRKLADARALLDTDPSEAFMAAGLLAAVAGQAQGPPEEMRAAAEVRDRARAIMDVARELGGGFSSAQG